MDASWMWLGAGVALMLLELVIPGLIVIWLGLAAVIVGGCIYMGWIDGWTAALFCWFGLSLGMVLFLRGAFERFLPGESERTSADEDADLIGTVVNVVADCGKTDAEAGRIMVRGVEWQARSVGHPIPAGAQATIVGRDNITWLVQPRA